jgi:hypothetical protein
MTGTGDVAMQAKEKEQSSIVVDIRKMNTEITANILRK